MVPGRAHLQEPFPPPAHWLRSSSLVFPSPYWVLTPIFHLPHKSQWCVFFPFIYLPLLDTKLLEVRDKHLGPISQSIPFV